jgi:hypothetical protein
MTPARLACPIFHWRRSALCPMCNSTIPLRRRTLSCWLPACQHDVRCLHHAMPNR